MRLYLPFLLLGLLVPLKAHPQAPAVPDKKVGLVLSGGGARGIAHIGVLLALEENNIPIDYIAGTSAGSIVGAFYAAGYSPTEIERIVKNEAPNWLLPGSVFTEDRYIDRTRRDMTALTLPLGQRDTRRLLPEYLYSDFEINIALVRYLTAASLRAGNNFDSLFVPFRCVASELFEERAIVLRQGSLAHAVRASMAVPAVFRPASNEKDQKLFDGGLYNNFPADVLLQDFGPDFLIGISVGTPPLKRSEYDERSAFVDKFLTQSTDQKTEEKLRPTDVFIRVDLGNLSVTDFSSEAIQFAIAMGYDAAMESMPEIKKAVARRTEPLQLLAKRKAFRAPALYKLSRVQVLGTEPTQQRFISRLIRHRFNFTYALQDVIVSYYRAKVFGNAASIFPNIEVEPKTKTVQVDYHIKPASRYSFSGGLAFYTPIDYQTQLIGRYSGVGAANYRSELSLMRGGFETSVRARSSGEFYNLGMQGVLQLEASYVNWNYQLPRVGFVGLASPAPISQFVYEAKITRAVRFRPSGIVAIGYAHHQIDWFYNKTFFTPGGDSTDRSSYIGGNGFITLESSTLDQKQYPTKGKHIYASVRLNSGREYFNPGRPADAFYTSGHSWVQARLQLQHYFTLWRHLAIGAGVEAAYSALSDFNNARASVLSSPRFQPFQESPIQFQQAQYAKAYVAPGLVLDVRLSRNWHLRAEGYYLQRLAPTFGSGAASVPKLNWDWNNSVAMASCGAYYNTIVGPWGIFLNQYGDGFTPYRVFIHLGFLVFSRHPWE